MAYGLARAGKRTLLIDLDPQAHSSIIFCPDIPKDGTVKEVFERTKVDLAPLIRPAEVKGKALANLWIVPSNIHLAVTAERMISQHYRERRLDQLLPRCRATSISSCSTARPTSASSPSTRSTRPTAF